MSLKKHGITTEFLYNKDLVGMYVMEDIAPVYLTQDKEEIVKIIQENNYDLIITIINYKRNSDINDERDSFAHPRRMGTVE